MEGLTENFTFEDSFQKQIISSMIQNPDLFQRVGILVDHKAFELKSYRDIYRCIKEFYSNYKSLPNKEILIENVSKINDNEIVKEDIEDIYSSNLKDSDINCIEDKVKEFVEFQAMKKAIIDSMDYLGDINKHSTIKNKIEEALNIRAQMEDNGICVYSPEAIIDRWKSRKEQTDVKVYKSNWKTLDKILNGGFESRTLTTFMGIANTGKSFYLVNIGVNMLLQGYNVVHITLENSEEQTIKRYDSCLLGLTQNELKQVDLNLYKEKLPDNIGDLFLKQFPAMTITADDVSAYIERVENISGKKIDVLIIDYADIMRSTNHYADKRFELEQIYVQLRNIALDKDIPVITATQLSRAAVSASKKGEIVDAEYIAESYAIQRTVDTSLTINGSPQDILNHTQILYVSKNRNGEMGNQIRMYVDFSKSLIKEWDNDTLQSISQQVKVESILKNNDNIFKV